MFFYNMSIYKLNWKCLCPSSPFHSILEYQPELLHFTFQLLRYSCIANNLLSEIQSTIIFMQKLNTFFSLWYLAGLKSQYYLTGTLWQSNNWCIELSLLTFVRWDTNNSSRHHTFIWNWRTYDDCHLHHEPECKLWLPCGVST